MNGATPQRTASGEMYPVHMASSIAEKTCLDQEEILSPEIHL